MCSLVLARIALWASRSLARFRASCEGVKVETLRVPKQLSVRYSHDGCECACNYRHDIPFRLVALEGSAEDDRTMLIDETGDEDV